MTFESVRQEVRKLNVELERMQIDPHRLEPSHAELKVVESIGELNYREEFMWRQRSRIMWLAAGDKNTLFFHMRVSRRHKRNKIIKIHKPNGQFT